ncbi:hypothetical protein EJ04DRAFT_590281 [Polyplosphaeria fusca]|uniref:Uncharacterized protein n=1 Tax=Polyplosphaeria fusca TaxID=682080 RepID=A0A9P4UXH5_9PLEO|nr:hypothetical protein EJ04DRAFT_590281 [Polyplosphaeria fusca]
MTSIFCCSSTKPYKAARLSHETKFNDFITWAAYPRETTETIDALPSSDKVPYAMQLVKQINYGPLESKRYFVVNADGDADKAFVEVSETWLIEANFEKLNAYKNFRCGVHNRFFEVNFYKKDPVNAHHWRASVARPGGEIDL